MDFYNLETNLIDGFYLKNLMEFDSLINKIINLEKKNSKKFIIYIDFDYDFLKNNYNFIKSLNRNIVVIYKNIDISIDSSLNILELFQKTKQEKSTPIIY